MLQMLLLLLSHFSCVRLCATHRWQTTRLPRPWDSPDKNTGVGCHFLFQCMKMKSESHEPRDCSLPGSSVHGIFQARVLEWGAIAFSGYKRYSDAIQMLYSFMYFPQQLYDVDTIINFTYKKTGVTNRLNDFPFAILQTEMANNSSILAWKITWTEECGRLQSMGFRV